MPPTVLDAVRELLTREGVEFRELRHEPTFTSEQSARARGEDIRVGGKALVLKIGEQHRLFVLSAARKLDSAAVKVRFGVKKVRFATADELQALSGLVPGSVPPFGPPILPFALHADTSVFENERIAFNAGSLTDSIIMATGDWQRVARPDVFAFSTAG